LLTNRPLGVETRQDPLRFCGDATRSATSTEQWPPAHGGAIVDIILSDPELTSLWTRELGEMRDRINDLRSLLVARFRDKRAGGRFDFIERQRGMFSFLGIDEAQIAILRERHGIYMVGSSRINIAGAIRANVDQQCDAAVSAL